MTHQQFRAGAGSAAHLDAARGIGRRQECFRPGRIVPVDESALRAVDRNRFSIGGEAGHADFQFFRFLAGALEERTGAADRTADAARNRIRPGVSRHAHRRLDLVETERHGDRCIGGKLQRIILGVGDMRLVARGTPGPHLGIGKGDFQRVELGDDFGELRRRQAVADPDEFLARHVHVDQHPGDPGRRHGHRLGRHRRVDMVAGDENIDHVEVGFADTIELDHAPVGNPDAGFRITGTFECGETVRGVFHRELVETQRTLIPIREPTPAVCAHMPLVAP